MRKRRVKEEVTIEPKGYIFALPSEHPTNFSGEITEIDDNTCMYGGCMRGFTETWHLL